MNFKLGLQLFQFPAHELCKERIVSTFKKIKGLGYDGVEYSISSSYSGEQIKDYAQAAELIPKSFGADIDQMKKDPMMIIKKAQTLGSKYIIAPYNEFESFDEIIYFANIYNGFGKACADNGLVLNYHNHFREFELFDGKFALEILLEKTNPKYLKAQFDVLFMHQMGVLSYDFIAKYKGRCPSIHVKDFKAPDFISMPIGTGEIDLSKLVEAASQCHTEWLIVEMSKPTLAENYFGKIEISMRNLKKFC